jgi:hypothetical protein
MEQKNSYVQLNIKNGTAFLIFHPKKADGRLCTLKETEYYLVQEGFTSYDRKKLTNLLESEEEAELRIGKSPYEFYSPLMETDVESGEIHTHSIIYPPSVNGPTLTKDDIIASLRKDHIRFGINEEKIDEFVKNPVYFTEIEFVTGQEQVEGKNGTVQYFFNTDKKLKPKTNEDGSVDFHSLNVINSVNEGDILVKIEKEVRGIQGMTVYGKRINPRPVKPAKCEVGKNVRANEDKTEFYAACTGHVRIIQGRVVVDDVYGVPKDVDNNTGNIDYSGNVHIKGSIRSGFSVRAGGDIVVEGVIEDANVDAGGQIIVKHGINSAGTNTIKSKSNIISKFIENGRIEAGGYVQSEVIMASSVKADGDIIVKGKKGFIAGSSCIAGGSVIADTIGSDMGSQTTIEAGQRPDVKKKLDLIRRSNAKLEEEIERFSTIIKNYNQSRRHGIKLDKKTSLYLIRVANALKMASEMLENNKRINDEIVAKLKEDTGSKIAAEKDFLPGTTIILYGHKKNITSKLSHCAFTFKDGDISKGVF